MRKISCRGLLCILIILVCMVTMFLHCNQNVLLGDDLFYRYILPAEELKSPNIGKQISSFNDAFESQTNQYFHTNGRFLVHIIVQLLAGAYPSPAFAIVSSALIAAVIIMFIWYTLNKQSRSNPLWWIIVALIWFYLYPSSDHLWYEIATNMNYLLPMSLVLAWLLMWRHIISHPQPSILFIVLISLLGFAVGWSQEGFSVPLSGGTFIYAIIKRRSLSIRQLIPLGFLYIGTAALILAPGNQHRIDDGGGIMGHVLNGINLYAQISLLWITVIIISIALWFKKPILIKHIKKYAVVWFTAIIAILFGLIANTQIRSFTGIEFYSIIIGISLADDIFPTKDRNPQNWIRSILSIILLVLFSIHQYIIISECVAVKEKLLSFIKDYNHSSDGILTIDTWDINSLAKPYVNIGLRPEIEEWAISSMNIAYAHNSKPIIILTGPEKEILTNPDNFFTKSRLIPGSAHAYASNKLWVKGAHSKPLTATLVRSNKQVTEKIINFIKHSTNHKFITSLPPIRTITTNQCDTFTMYYKPAFDIIQIDMYDN